MSYVIMCLFIYLWILCIDEDFNSVTFEVVFAPNQTMADLLITAHKDVLLEQNETFFVRLELSEGIDMIGVKIAEENNIASVTIINNNGRGQCTEN